MASGQKNYFRHSFFAGKDDKIVNLIAEHGKQAYFHYFRLLELCAEQAMETRSNEHIFHRRTLCAELMISNSRLDHHLSAMQSSLLLDYVLDSRKARILIPKLLKYLGRYETKSTPNSPNKRKEKKIKEKEIKEAAGASNAPDNNQDLKDSNIPSETTSRQHSGDKSKNHDHENSVTEIINYFNLVTGKKLRSNNQGNKKFIIARLKENYSIDDFKKVIDNMNSAWSGDEKMKNYIQPSTLFSNKFDQYLNSQPKETFEMAEKKLAEFLNNSLAKLDPPDPELLNGNDYKPDWYGDEVLK